MLSSPSADKNVATDGSNFENPLPANVVSAPPQGPARPFNPRKRKRKRKTQSMTDRFKESWRKLFFVHQQLSWTPVEDEAIELGARLGDMNEVQAIEAVLQIVQKLEGYLVKFTEIAQSLEGTAKQLATETEVHRKLVDAAANMREIHEQCREIIDTQSAQWQNLKEECGRSSKR
ncbi:uncharacterized protein RHO25_004421 [Cercospora beticola]|uniref:Uncharacterized protein n=1 Tax=Cercospora beticola TaxID=122368 RepID=A0ABZ0NJS5_CERBT|nr:hypothetical protein RHO25_004421 [Cercospora beticola]CAK1362042.1 unnamed protein product [Cercospora beticola]